MTEQQIAEDIVKWNIAGIGNRIIYEGDTAAFFHDIEGDNSLIKDAAKKAARTIPNHVLPLLTSGLQTTDFDELRDEVETTLIHYLKGHVMYLISMLGHPDPDEPEEKKQRFHWTIACMGNRAFERLPHAGLKELLDFDKAKVYTEALREATQIPYQILLSLMGPNDRKDMNLAEIHNVIALWVSTYISTLYMYHLSKIAEGDPL